MNILFIILALFILKLRYIQKQKQTKNLLGTLILVFTLCKKRKKNVSVESRWVDMRHKPFITLYIFIEVGSEELRGKVA